MDAIAVDRVAQDEDGAVGEERQLVEVAAPDERDPVGSGLAGRAVWDPSRLQRVLLVVVLRRTLMVSWGAWSARPPVRSEAWWGSTHEEPGFCEGIAQQRRVDVGLCFVQRTVEGEWVSCASPGCQRRPLTVRVDGGKTSRARPGR